MPQAQDFTLLETTIQAIDDEIAKIDEQIADRSKSHQGAIRSDTGKAEGNQRNEDEAATGHQRQAAAEPTGRIRCQPATSKPAERSDHNPPEPQRRAAQQPGSNRRPGTSSQKETIQRSRTRHTTTELGGREREGIQGPGRMFNLPGIQSPLRGHNSSSTPPGSSGKGKSRLPYRQR